jgi:RNA polymerase sigma-70 factor (ECF subfamily)
VAVSGTSEVFNTVQADQIVKLLYTTGYRLTGNHRLTAELIDGSINALNLQGQHGRNKLFKGIVRKQSGRKIPGASIMLKTLCTTFLHKTTVVNGRKHTAVPLRTYEFSPSKPQMQEVLLQLPPLERLLVVLRDILGLTYIEMAELTGLEKSEVACFLSAGRWSLRELLDTPETQGNLSKPAGTK